MQFTLNITLGNDAMQTVDDLSDALSRVSGLLITLHRGLGPTVDAHMDGAIRDVNGNRVGDWSITEESYVAALEDKVIHHEDRANSAERLLGEAETEVERLGDQVDYWQRVVRFWLGRIDRYHQALIDIQEQDSAENAVDPQWAARIATAALASPRTDLAKETE